MLIPKPNTLKGVSKMKKDIDNAKILASVWPKTKYQPFTLIHVSDRLAQISRLDVWAKWESELGDGVYSLSELKAGLVRKIDYDSAELPKFEDIVKPQIFPLPDESFSRFVSSDVTRPALMGICVELGGGICSTNGYFAQYLSTSVSECSIIPAWIPKIGKKIKADKLLANAECGQICGAGLTIGFKLIDEPFPNYYSVIPQEFAHETTISLAQIAKLNQAQAQIKLSRPKTRQISGDGICEGVNLDCDMGLPEDYAYNAVLLLEVLKDAKSNVTAKFNGPLGAHIFEVQTKQGAFNRLLMPLRPNN